MHGIATLVLALLVAAPAAAQAPDASGRWDTLIKAPDGPPVAVLTLKKEGDVLEGTIVGPEGEFKVSGTQKGADLSIAFAYRTNEGPILITLTGVQKGDAIDGTATFGDDTGTWSAKRVPTAPGGAPASPRPAAPDVTGAWLFEVTTGAGSGTPTITFKQEGESLTGRYDGQLGQAPVQGTLKGEQIAFGFELSIQDVKVQVVYTGTASKDSMKGTVRLGQLGEGTFTARRQ